MGLMEREAFKKEYSKLNPRQKSAVDTIEGPLMVIAGPGTGKTTVLTLRIANILLQTDTPPSGILALTFTDAGVRAMKEKLQQIIGERALEVPIHTFHGFAAGVLAEYSDHFPHLYRSRQMTDIEAEALIRDILKAKRFAKLRPLGEPDFYISKILGTIAKSKQEAWTPEMLRDFAKTEIERVKADPESISKSGASKGSLKGEALKQIEKCERTILLSAVYEEYEQRKQRERKMDFDDLLFELVQALKNDRLLLQNLQERYLYILVDEHQDTNDSQNLIVHLIASFFEAPNIFVVGDEKQAIYRFQGASVENFLSFQQIWKGMKVIPLTENYRSHQGLLDASFSMIEQNYRENEHPKLRIKLKAAKKERIKSLEVAEAPDLRTEELHLVQKIKNLRAKEPDKTVAVIVRRNSDAERIFSLLQKNKVPALAERAADIFSHPLSLTFFALLEFLHNPQNIEALSETFAAGLWGLSLAQQAELIKLVRSGRLEEAAKQIPEITKLKKEMPYSGTTDFLILAAELSGFSEMAATTPLGAAIWRGIFSLAENISSAKAISDPRGLIKELLDFKKSARGRSVKIRSGDPEAKVTVSTAHGAKGLEFDYVFLPYATEEVWISKNRASFFVLPREKEAGDDLRDERRLFYVALTRARSQVYISFSRRDEQGRELLPLRFIGELDQKQVLKTMLEMKDEDVLRPLTEAAKLREAEKAAYAKQVILEDGISVSTLNIFLKCPSEFFYRCILKMPEPSSVFSEKGNAMHEAIASVWRAKKSGAMRPKTISDILSVSIKNYFKTSPLPLFEKETILDELLANAPLVAKALESHFNQEGSVSTERWLEASLEKKEGEFSLRGRLDALVEREKELLVFDYKTRETMSLASVKGETKTSERMNGGGYFRQMVFYRMLLKQNPRFRGKDVETAIVFVKPDKKGRCQTLVVPVGRSDLEKLMSEIDLLVQNVWSGAFLALNCPDPACKYCALKKLE